MSAFMFVKAMKTLTGKVVFPFLSACGLVLSLLVAIRLWQERLGRSGIIAMTLAVMAVICTNPAEVDPSLRSPG